MQNLQNQNLMQACANAANALEKLAKALNQDNLNDNQAEQQPKQGG